MPDTIIIGLGNPLLGDDGVGWRVAQEVALRLPERVAEFDNLAVGGIGLMERLIGYRRAIIIDVLNTGSAPRGTVHCFPLEALANPFYGHLGSAHETNLQTALEVGRMLGAELPGEVTVVGIESPYVYQFCDTLSEDVEAAVPAAVAQVLALLGQAPEAGVRHAVTERRPA